LASLVVSKTSNKRKQKGEKKKGKKKIKMSAEKDEDSSHGSKDPEGCILA
jgi:hypothetical protein